MRVTRQKLVQLAKQEVDRRAESDGTLLSAYLIGSTARSEPLLGGTADIDLVLIHDAPPAEAAEIVPLSPEIHLDITHHSAGFYEHPTQLRIDPWWGPALSEPVFLHDPQHFFERAQAGARGQFHRPDHAIARARTFLDQARRSRERLLDDRCWPQDYLRAALAGANAVTSLATVPAAGRRLALTLESGIAAVGAPEIHTAFMRLLSAETVRSWQVPDVLSAWARAFDAAYAQSQRPCLQPARRSYLLGGFQALAEAGFPEANQWLLLHTWDHAIRSLPDTPDNAGYRSVWQALLSQLGLLPTAIGLRLDELEAFLDQAEAVLEKWAHDNGA